MWLRDDVFRNRNYRGAEIRELLIASTSDVYSGKNAGKSVRDPRVLSRIVHDQRDKDEEAEEWSKADWWIGTANVNKSTYVKNDRYACKRKLPKR